MEKASADRVDPTTLAIFLEVQVKGLTGATCSNQESSHISTYLEKRPVVLHLQKKHHQNSHGLTDKLEYCENRDEQQFILGPLEELYLLKTMFERWLWKSVPELLQALRLCRDECGSLHRLPMTPLNLLNSGSFTGASGVCLRVRPMSIAGILRTYSC